jgi:hypothetical protein
VSDALGFARRVDAQKVLLFHHDPLHSDEFLDGFCGQVTERWEGLGGEVGQVELATERREIAIAQDAAQQVRAATA